MEKIRKRTKYEKYFQNCVSGHNQSGRKLRPGAKPDEIFPIDVWREEKRTHGYEPIIPSNSSTRICKEKKRRYSKISKTNSSNWNFIATILGVVAWWE